MFKIYQKHNATISEQSIEKKIIVSIGKISEPEQDKDSEQLRKNRAIKIAAGWEGTGQAASNIINAVSGGSVINIGGSNIGIVSTTGNQSPTITGRDNVVTAHSDIKKRVVYEEQAFERINAAVRMNLEQLEGNIAQARKESNQFFKLTLVFSGLGFLVVLAAVGLLLGRQTVAGIVSTIASAIPEVTAALFFKKDKELRGSIEKYHHHLMESQRILTMIDVAETVQNKEERDSIKREIICKALGIDASTVGGKMQMESNTSS